MSLLQIVTKGKRSPFYYKVEKHVLQSFKFLPLIKKEKGYRNLQKPAALFF